VFKYDDQHDTSWSRFHIAATRIWFDTLRSVALLAGIQVLNSKHPNILRQTLIVISLFLIWQYFLAIFDRIRLNVSNRLRRVQIGVSAVISCALAYGCYRLAQAAVFLIAAATKT
jgi:hypothetical protein